MSTVYPSRLSIERRLQMLREFPHEPYAQWEAGVLELALRGYDTLDSTNPPAPVPASEYEDLGRKVMAAVDDLTNKDPNVIREDADAVEEDWHGYGGMIRAVADFLERT